MGNKLYPTILAILGSIVILFSSVSSSLAQSTSSKGEKELSRVAEFLFSSRLVNFSNTITHSGKTYSNSGLFISDKSHGYIKIDGISEVEYSPNEIFFYNYSTNELTISRRKTDSYNILENPFMLFQKNKGVAVSAPIDENYNGQNLYTITVTPIKKGSYKVAKIFYTKDSYRLVKVDITTRNGDRFELEILKYSEANKHSMNDFKVNSIKFPNATINDLR